MNHSSRDLSRALTIVNETSLLDWRCWVDLEACADNFAAILEEWSVDNVLVEHLKERHLTPNQPPPPEGLREPLFGIILLCPDVAPPIDLAAPTAPQPDGKGIWFANHVVGASQPTVALLNILMNRHTLLQIDNYGNNLPSERHIFIGPVLENFHQQTVSVADPKVRGFLLSENRGIRAAHNRFARAMEILEADLCLDENAERRRRHPMHRIFSRSRTANSSVAATPCKYVAFTLINGHVWKLDSSLAAPVCIGGVAVGQPWLPIAMPEIHRLRGGESARALAVSGGVKIRLQKEIATFISTIGHIDRFLLQINYPMFQLEHIPIAPEALGMYGLTLNQIWNTKPLWSANHTIYLRQPTEEARAARVDEVLRKRQEMMTALLDRLLQHAQNYQRIENALQRASLLKKDYTAMIHTWLRAIVERGQLPYLIAAAGLAE